MDPHFIFLVILFRCSQKFSYLLLSQIMVFA